MNYSFVKRFFLFLFLILGSSYLIAQNPMKVLEKKEKKKEAFKRDKKYKTNEESILNLSIRAQEFNKEFSRDTEKVVWKRIIYRNLSLDSVENAPLYYPPRPTEKEKNLFSTLFSLISEGNITAYEYTDGREVFDLEHQLKFKEFLDRFGIYYKEEIQKGEKKYIVSDVDVPSDLVKAYFVKEEYYFDPINSTIDREVLAICPVLYEAGDLGTGLHYPLFWIKYKDLRPYISTQLIMLSDLNNSTQSTLESYFRMSLYKGQIYKTNNLLGRVLAQYCPTPDSLHHEQERIEKELLSFEEELWKNNVETNKDNEDKEVIKKENKKEKGKTARARRQKKIKKKNFRSKKRREKTSSGSKRSARSRF